MADVCIHTLEPSIYLSICLSLSIYICVHIYIYIYIYMGVGFGFFSAWAWSQLSLVIAGGGVLRILGLFSGRGRSFKLSKLLVLSEDNCCLRKGLPLPQLPMNLQVGTKHAN